MLRIIYLFSIVTVRNTYVHVVTCGAGVAGWVP